MFQGFQALGPVSRGRLPSRRAPGQVVRISPHHLTAPTARGGWARGRGDLRGKQTDPVPEPAGKVPFGLVVVEALGAPYRRPSLRRFDFAVAGGAGVPMQMTSLEPRSPSRRLGG